jgi:hypothetical protein
MLGFLRGRITERKLRLFTSACCRSIWPFLVDERSRHAVAVIERRVDGLASNRELETALTASEATEVRATGRARAAARACVAVWSTAEHACSAAAQAAPDPQAERAHQAALLRDLAGNPFHPVAVELSWLDWNGGLVARIAQTLYDERRFDELPVLADALEEAGCTNEAILTHCRSGAEHALGCWVLDRLLGVPVVPDVDVDSLPAWTVASTVEQEGRCIRQTSCPGHYAVVTLRVEPAPAARSVVFFIAAPALSSSQHWLPAVEEGVRQFVADQAEQGKRVTGVRAVLTGLRDHPVDSRARSFELAAAQAMVLAFGEAGVHG